MFISKLTPSLRKQMDGSLKLEKDV